MHDWFTMLGVLLVRMLGKTKNQRVNFFSMLNTFNLSSGAKWTTESSELVRYMSLDI